MNDAKKQELVDSVKLPVETPHSLSVSASDQALAMMSMIKEVAMSPGAEDKVAIMREMLAMNRQLMKDEAERAFNESMRAVQSEIQPIAKKADTDRYKFAEYDAIDDAIRPIYTKHGFSLTFGSKNSDKGICVVCTALHVAGHSRDYELSGALDTTGAKGGANKTEIQGTGSSASYLQKYLTRMIFNVVTKKDTDGNAQVEKEFITTEQAAALDLRLRAISEQALPNFLKWAKLDAVTSIYANKLTVAEAAIADLEAKAKTGKKGAA